MKFDNTYLRLPDKLYSKQKPVPVTKPDLHLFNQELADRLSLSFDDFSKDDLAQLFSGNKIPSNTEPFAQAYAGHQFGHFTMLGDGRAIMLGEIVSPDGNRYDLQFKGSGRTPYSRGGDGRATLYSMLREYLISESMHHLGIPTSRSLAVTGTGEPVYREEIHRGAVLTRVMSSHIRSGTFEYIRQFHDLDTLKTFTDYTINRHYPHLMERDNPALELLKAVSGRLTDLVVEWLRVGFIHGVMNTDNTSICGETFDYGPCAFMNAYDPKTVFSSIDTGGRYAFGNQPGIAQWNLAVFAGTLLQLIDDDETKAQKLAQKVIDDFPAQFSMKWKQMMFNKLGFKNSDDSDAQLVHELLKWMQLHDADYTNTFRFIMGDDFLPDEFTLIYKAKDFHEWFDKWNKRVDVNEGGKKAAIDLMKKANPVVIPRNHLVEEALKKASEDLDFSAFNELAQVLNNPYSSQDVKEKFLLPPDSEETYKTFCGT